MEMQNLTEFNAEQASKTLPRSNNSSISALSTSSAASAQNNGSRPFGVLEYFDLDHSNPPPICKNNNTSASTSNLNTQLSSHDQPIKGAHHQRFSSFSTLSRNDSIGATSSTNVSLAAAQSGIVYKSVDFIKTEAFMRTRQDAELARAQSRSKE